MTKAEAIAITSMLPNVHQDIQEVQLRLKFHTEGTMELTDDSIADSINRLKRSVEAIITINKMAYAELGDD